MALRFRQRIRIAPGISLNLSKSGIGASIGPRGAKVSVGVAAFMATWSYRVPA
ncbi:DUF4236 domain-containing protein [Franzmannia qiaohouensis]|uniref:DUF4236 domain-containing protein n=1 Tax=Franzmannia qiaohouensis TaxID=1329370 RepID=UPI003BEF3F9F